MSTIKKNLTISTIMVISITLISKIIGLLRDLLIAQKFGATYQTDAFNIAFIIPGFLFSILGMAITTTFIPLLSEELKKKGKEKMFEFANNVMSIIFIISIILLLLGMIFTPELVKLFAPSFNNKTYELAVILTRISVLNVLFMSLSSGFTAILQTLNDYTSPALIGISMNLPVIIYMMFLKNLNITGLTIISVVGFSLQVVVQIPWLKKHKYKFKIILKCKNSNLKRMLYLIIPVMIGACVNEINSIINNALGSSLEEGTISALNYASRMNLILYSIFAQSIVTVLYPEFARMVIECDFKELKLKIIKTINNINIIMIPTITLLIVLSKPIIKLLFMRGEFNEKALLMTVIALNCFAIGTLFYGIRDIFNRIFYSMNDTKTPMINGIIGLTINIVFNLVFAKKIGIAALALSTSVSAIICTFLLYLKLRKKIKLDIIISDIKISIKALLSSSIMAVIIYVINDRVYKEVTSKNVYNIMYLIIMGTTFFIIYLMMLNDFKIGKINKQLRSVYGGSYE